MKSINFLIVILAVIFLTSCGTDDGGSTNGATQGSEVDLCGGMNEEACDAYYAVNTERIIRGLEPLDINATCVQAAQDHAEDMVARGYFGHDSPTETFRERMNRYGLGNGAGENIAMTGGDPVAMWMNSSGHRANILRDTYRSAGMGYYQNHYVQVFYLGNGDVVIFD